MWSFSRRSKASRCAVSARVDLVSTFMPAAVDVAQARTNCPLTSTRQVSHVWMGAELVMITDRRNLGVPAQQDIDEKFAWLCFNGLPVQCQFDRHKQSPLF